MKAIHNPDWHPVRQNLAVFDVKDTSLKAIHNENEKLNYYLNAVFDVKDTSLKAIHNRCNKLSHRKNDVKDTSLKAIHNIQGFAAQLADGQLNEALNELRQSAK